MARTRNGSTKKLLASRTARGVASCSSKRSSIGVAAQGKESSRTPPPSTRTPTHLQAGAMISSIRTRTANKVTPEKIVAEQYENQTEHQQEQERKDGSEQVPYMASSSDSEDANAPEEDEEDGDNNSIESSQTYKQRLQACSRSRRRYGGATVSMRDVDCDDDNPFHRASSPNSPSPNKNRPTPKMSPIWPIHTDFGDKSVEELIPERNKIVLRQSSRRATIDRRTKITSNLKHVLFLEPTMQRQAAKRHQKEREYRQRIRRHARRAARKQARRQAIEAQRLAQLHARRTYLMDDFARVLVVPSRNGGLRASKNRMPSMISAAQAAKARSRNMSDITPPLADLFQQEEASSRYLPHDQQLEYPRSAIPHKPQADQLRDEQADSQQLSPLDPHLGQPYVIMNGATLDQQLGQRPIVLQPWSHMERRDQQPISFPHVPLPIQSVEQRPFTPIILDESDDEGDSGDDEASRRESHENPSLHLSTDGECNQTGTEEHENFGNTKPSATCHDPSRMPCRAAQSCRKPKSGATCANTKDDSPSDISADGSNIHWNGREKNCAHTNPSATDRPPSSACCRRTALVRGTYSNALDVVADPLTELVHAKLVAGWGIQSRMNDYSNLVMPNLSASCLFPESANFLARLYAARNPSLLGIPAPQMPDALLLHRRMKMITFFQFADDLESTLAGMAILKDFFPDELMPIHLSQRGAELLDWATIKLKREVMTVFTKSIHIGDLDLPMHETLHKADRLVRHVLLILQNNKLLLEEPLEEFSLNIRRGEHLVVPSLKIFVDTVREKYIALIQESSSE